MNNSKTINVLSLCLVVDVSLRSERTLDFGCTASTTTTGAFASRCPSSRATISSICHAWRPSVTGEPILSQTATDHAWTPAARGATTQMTSWRPQRVKGQPTTNGYLCRTERKWNWDLSMSGVLVRATSSRWTETFFTIKDQQQVTVGSEWLQYVLSF